MPPIHFFGIWETTALTDVLLRLLLHSPRPDPPMHSLGPLSYSAGDEIEYHLHFRRDRDRHGVDLVSKERAAGSGRASERQKTEQNNTRAQT